MRRSSASPLPGPSPGLSPPAQVDVRPLHGGQPGEQRLQVAGAGHVVVQRLGEQRGAGKGGGGSSPVPPRRSTPHSR